VFCDFLSHIKVGMQIVLKGERRIQVMKRKFKDLLTSVDVLNTLHGGVSEPFVSMQEQATSHEVHVRVPGIDKEKLQVEVNENQLSVFYMIPIQSLGKLILMPQIVYNQPIPHFIEISAINARFEENELVVELPFNALSNGYNQKVKIS
jgi:HSP20 family molecular chaperone IbpA